MEEKENESVGQTNTIEHSELLQELGDRYCSVDNYAQAQKYYEKAALLAPDEAGPYVGLGAIALQNKLLDDAELSFRVACRLDRGCAKAYAGLATVAQERENYEQAFEMYLKCLELDADNLAALLGLFQTSCQMGSFAKVIYYLQLYLEMHPDDIAVMFSLAALYVKEELFEESRKILLEILTLDGGNTDAAALLEEVEHNLVKAGKIEV